MPLKYRALTRHANLAALSRAASVSAPSPPGSLTGAQARPPAAASRPSRRTDPSDRGPLRILAGVTWFPGLRRAGAVRQLRVTADAQRMIEWLTDSGRREPQWRRLAGHRADIRDPHADRLPGGGLRYRYEWVDGRRVWRFTIEDVAVSGNTIERAHRGAACPAARDAGSLGHHREHLR
jgi:hypothetical protein